MSSVDFSKNSFAIDSPIEIGLAGCLVTLSITNKELISPLARSSPNHGKH
jgi:hypothetical protein